MRKSDEILSELRSFTTTIKYQCSRFSDNGLEVTTRGDEFGSQFSPFFARIDGKSLEDIYQLEIKGFKYKGCTSWRDCKGLEPLFKNIDTRKEYKELYLRWLSLNPDKLLMLAKEAEGKVLTDMFWSNKDELSQASILCEILNELFYKER